jgi:hypothetical protein
MERAMHLLILCQTGIDNHLAAIKLIEKGITQRLPMMVYLAVEPMLKPLRPDSRFQELMRQVLGEKGSFEGEKR